MLVYLSLSDGKYIRSRGDDQNYTSFASYLFGLALLELKTKKITAQSFADLWTKSMQFRSRLHGGCITPKPSNSPQVLREAHPLVHIIHHCWVQHRSHRCRAAPTRLTQDPNQQHQFSPLLSTIKNYIEGILSRNRTVLLQTIICTN